MTVGLAAQLVLVAVLLAVALLGLFAGIVVNLARGRAPDCRCFEQLHCGP